VIRGVNEILRELHEAADYPSAPVMSRDLGVSLTLISNVMTGRRMGTWGAVRALAVYMTQLVCQREGLDRDATTERVNEVVRKLRTVFTRLPTDYEEAK
jgi:hypothetical protein